MVRPHGGGHFRSSRACLSAENWTSPRFPLSNSNSTRRGKPQQPTEFGYKVSIAHSPEGFVVSHQVYTGNPADAQTLSM